MKTVIIGNKEAKGTARLIEYFNNNVEVDLFCCTFAELQINIVDNNVSFAAGDVVLDNYDVFFFKGAGKNRNLVKTFIEYLESKNKIVLDSSRGITNYYTDKIVLENTRDISILNQVIIHKEQLLKEANDFPYILKHIDSSQGYGVFLVKSKEDLDAAIKAESKYEHFIKQPFLTDAEEYRVMVVGDKAYGALKRVLIDSDDDFRANRKYKSIKTVEVLPKEILDQCVVLTKNRGLSFSGVDLIKHNNQFYVLEVNSSPDFLLFDSFLETSMPENILNLLKSRFKNT